MGKILITGGAGFIGSHLCEYLLNKGENIICLDNLFTGQEKSIEPFLGSPNFQFIKSDIINGFNLDDEEVSQIYNLACPASPVHYQYNPIQTIKANTEGVIRILELAKKWNARVLQTSTSEVYGDPEVHPQKEEYRGNVNPIGPRACYDEGKRVAETLFFDYYRHHSVDIRVARIFNTYGPKMAKNDGRVVSNFIIQALAGENITIYGNGEQTRSFCYVSDMIEGLYRLMNKEGITGPINLGNPYELKILEIAERVIGLVGSKSRLVFKDLPEDDPLKRRPDISLAKEVLGWAPVVGLENGLKGTIEYFKSSD